MAICGSPSDETMGGVRGSLEAALAAGFADPARDPRFPQTRSNGSSACDARSFRGWR